MCRFIIRFVILLSLVSFSSLAMASFWGIGSNAPPPVPPSPVKVLSPQDFKSTVNTVNQQTQSSLSSQLNQQTSKKGVPATPPPPSSSSSSSPTSTTTITTVPPKPANAPQAVAPPPPPPIEEAPVQAVAPAPSTVFTAPANQPAGQGQVYTGFQGGNNGNNTNDTNQTTNSSGQPSGGWNIKY